MHHLYQYYDNPTTRPVPRVRMRRVNSNHDVMMAQVTRSPALALAAPPTRTRTPSLTPILILPPTLTPNPQGASPKENYVAASGLELSQ